MNIYAANVALLWNTAMRVGLAAQDTPGPEDTVTTGSSPCEGCDASACVTPSPDKGPCRPRQ